jgi:hypothetical protein
MRGNFSEATKTHKLALANLLQAHGEDYPDVVTTYNGITVC